jgi:hypothetical protein
VTGTSLAGLSFTEPSLTPRSLRESFCEMEGEMAGTRKICSKQNQTTSCDDLGQEVPTWWYSN